MTTTDEDTRRAQDSLRRAVINIINRSRDSDADAEYVALEIDNVYAGHGFAYQPRPATGIQYCPTHKWIMKPCGLCPPISRGNDDA